MIRLVILLTAIPLMGLGCLLGLDGDESITIGDTTITSTSSVGISVGDE